MTERPLILHVVPTLSIGGAERIAVELASRLPDHGFRTKLVALFEGGPLAAELRARNVRWTQLLSSHSGSRIELVSRLARLISDAERRPAIVHAHLFGSDVYGVIARRFAHARRLPFVSTAHNIDHEDTSLRRFARRWAARRMDMVVAISNDVARYAREDLGVNAKRIRVIPNGIETERIDARGDRPFGNPPRLVLVGRLVPQKGHAVLLNALASVPPPWQLDIVGSGRLERDLREQAERLGIASRVRFLGERNDVGQLLAGADLFCFPSQWEGMGLALLEAMAAGVPVLASDLPAVREFAPKSRLVDPASPSAWSNAIRATLADPAPAIAEARKTEPAIRKKFGAERMVERYAELYRELIG